MRSLEAGMNTRSISDKDEIDDLYKTAIGNQSKSKLHTPSTIYTSTPTGTPTSKSGPRQVEFLLDDTLVSKDKIKDITDTLQPVSDDSVDVTIQPTYKADYIPSYKNINNNMAHPNPFATLKYAVEAVPFFDGQNIPLSYFIEGCEEAKSMLPDEAEPQFTKIIRTRIVGEARRTIQDQDFNSVSQLTKYLKQIYGPSKNVYQLQGELGCVYQKNEEDIVAYANRVKLLGKQILEACRSSGSALPDQNIKASLEKDMCKCFIRGLKPEIEQRIVRNLDVQGTVADALRIERELLAMTDLRQGQNVRSGPDKLRGYVNSSRESCQICHKEGHSAINCRRLTSTPFNKHDLGTEILVCQICKKRGHSANKCRFRDPQSLRSVKIVQANTVTCQLCSKPGHNAKTCQLANNMSSQTNQTPVICQWCDKTGHLANNCWKKQNDERNLGSTSKIVCQICNKFGHVARDCRSKSNQQESPKDNVFCRYCKETGHLLESCQLRAASNNRRKISSQGNSIGPSKPGVQQGSERIPHPTTSQQVE